jgi:hypothetical protein
MKRPTEKIDTKRNMNSILPNFVHSLDANQIASVNTTLIYGACHDLFLNLLNLYWKVRDANNELYLGQYYSLSVVTSVIDIMERENSEVLNEVFSEVPRRGS